MSIGESRDWDPVLIQLGENDWPKHEDADA